jgi:DNA polymerase III delta prime subunit
MTAEMNEICCNTLRHFVLVCQKALRLRTSVLFKVKTFASIAFLSKNEFSDLLATMKSLAFTEIMQSAADTYKNVNETKDLSKGTFAFIQSHQNEKAEERKTNKERSILIDALALEGGKDKWNSTMKAPVASWTATYQNIQQNTVSGTGGWLLKEKAFKAWVKQKSDTPILAVVGEEATGKSYLAANTIFNLQKHGSGEETGSRHHVGYFFVGEKKDNAGIDALGKSIIWQFAVSDLSYMQSIANICDKGGPIGPKEFLTKLLLDNHKEMQKIDATFYIVVNKLADEKDNIHDGVVDFLRSAKHSSNKSVRIIFTTTQGAVDKLKNQGLEFPVIPMSRNTGDIQKYIDWRMDSIGVLSNLKNEQIKKLRDEIKSKLPGQTHRSYYMIDNFLERISTMDLDKDIREALGNAGGDLARRIDADIKRLNEARTSEELEDINTMIIWIMFAKERMTVEKMNAVLEFRNGAVSLTSLEDRLRKKFLLFEVDNSGCVDFRSEQILAGIHERATVAKEQAMSSDTVNEGEVKILTHFLGTVCPPGLVDKLELREHFHSKLKPAAERVYKEDKNTAHFHLARTCLGVLVDKESPTLKVLRGYAARQLVAHMSKVTLGLIGSHLKKDIGSNLVQLFRSGHAIDNQFWANEAEPGFPKWLGHDGEPEASIICDWLRANPPSLEKDPKARAWVEQLLDEQAPLKTLLKPSILRMAHYAFQDYQSDSITDRAYRLVLSFTSQVGTFKAIVSCLC